MGLRHPVSHLHRANCNDLLATNKYIFSFVFCCCDATPYRHTYHVCRHTRIMCVDRHTYHVCRHTRYAQSAVQRNTCDTHTHHDMCVCLHTHTPDIIHKTQHITRVSTHITHVCLLTSHMCVYSHHTCVSTHTTHVCLLTPHMCVYSHHTCVMCVDTHVMCFVLCIMSCVCVCRHTHMS